MKKTILLAGTFLLCSLSTQAQFRKLIDKAKEKAIESVLGTSAPDTASSSPTPGTAPTEPDAQPASPSPGTADASPQQSAAPPKAPTIDFPRTGVTVKATHAVIAPVIDGDVSKIVATPQGQYGISVAREKGLKGTDEEVFKQLLDLKNAAIMQSVDSMVDLKFPEPEDKDQHPSSPVAAGNNPAWGGISAPSLYFDIMVGSFDIWMTDHYIKTTMKNDHFTMSQAFGVNMAAITDLDKRMVYNIGSVLAVNFTSVKPLDSSSTRTGDYGASLVLPLLKKQYLGLKGVKIEPGAGGKFGEYNTVSEKLIVPVQPYVDPETHALSNSLLGLHDILADREDAVANDGQGQYNPSYRIIYEYYFTHDFDKYLPENLKNIETAAMREKGMCVGAAIEDENGNRAIYRITDVSTDQPIDKGQFQIPADYPVMTQDELKKAIRKKIGAGIFKGMLPADQSH